MIAAFYNVGIKDARENMKFKIILTGDSK